MVRVKSGHKLQPMRLLFLERRFTLEHDASVHSSTRCVGGITHWSKTVLFVLTLVLSSYFPLPRWRGDAVDAIFEVRGSRLKSMSANLGGKCYQVSGVLASRMSHRILHATSIASEGPYQSYDPPRSGGSLHSLAWCCSLMGAFVARKCNS